MKLLDDYFKLREQVHNYFGYTEDWAVIPIDDATEYYWILTNDCVQFAEKKENLSSEKKDFGHYYENDIYFQRHLPQHVYPTEDYTMICVDTHTDGNKFLQIFDNSKKLEE